MREALVPHLDDEVVDENGYNDIDKALFTSGKYSIIGNEIRRVLRYRRSLGLLGKLRIQRKPENRPAAVRDLTFVAITRDSLDERVMTGLKQGSEVAGRVGTNVGDLAKTYKRPDAETGLGVLSGEASLSTLVKTAGTTVHIGSILASGIGGGGVAKLSDWKDRKEQKRLAPRPGRDLPEAA